jgi:membrane protein required for colicin V production
VSLNWLDIVLIAVLVVSMVMSARKGFSREIIGLAAALFALVLAMWFYGLAGSFVAPFVSSPRVANLLGFLLVVFGVLVCGGLLGWIVNRFLRTVGLSFFDHLLGAIFGLVRGLLIAIALLTAFTAFGPSVDSGMVSSSMLNSQIAPRVLEASRVFVAMAPMELKSSFLREYAQLQTALGRNLPPSDNERSSDTHERKF